MTDRARPGLVALYNIWPGNGAGQFLQPRSLHGATTRECNTICSDNRNGPVNRKSNSSNKNVNKMLIAQQYFYLMKILVDL